MLDVRRPAVVVVLLVVFCLTRVAVVWLTENPDVYGDVDPTSDVTIYENWGNAVHVDGASPYADVKIEYPPGAIPFLVGPSVVSDVGESYRLLFALLMAAVDAVAIEEAVDLRLAGVAPRTADLVGRALRAVVGVRQVMAVVEPEGAD